MAMIRPVQSTFSHSSLGSFETCPRKYWFRYVEKVAVDTEGIEAFVGKRVHEVLERLYQFADRGQLPSLERVLHRYHLNWDEQFEEERVRIVRQGTDAAFYRDAGVRCLTHYYRRHYPFDSDQTLGLERRIRFSLDPAGRYSLRGVIDRLVRARDGAVEIHDFKTSRRVPSQKEIDRDRQLALYEIGVRSALEAGEFPGVELGPGDPVRLVWHFVHSDQVRTSRRTHEQLETLRRETTALIDRVRAETGWEARKSPLCDWCEYRPMCPAFGGEIPASALADADETDGPAPDQLQLI